MRCFNIFLFFALFSVLFFFISCKQSDSSSSGEGEEIVNEPNNTITVEKLSKEDFKSRWKDDYMVVVVKAGETATITGSDDNWKGFYSEDVEAQKSDTADDTGENKKSQKYAESKKGVFVAKRNVSLSPYEIGKYEVTQELYGWVIEKNPSYCRENERYPLLDGEREGDNKTKWDLNRPVENVSWYDAVVFCNELTKLLMKEEECVYYSDEEFQKVYASGDKEVFYNSSKKGYRLPTEAEWEFAARGGNAEDEVFKYAYAGGSKGKDLDSCGWYNANLSGSVTSPLVEAGKKGYGTHVVGKKSGNSLGIFDMSGNVREWCYDIYNNDPCFGDESYKGDDGILSNPRGAKEGAQRVCRGGSWMREDFVCSVAYRASYVPNKAISSIGFRLARSL